MRAVDIRSLLDKELAQIEAGLEFSPRPFKRPDGRLSVGFGHVLRRGESFTELTVEAARHLLALDVAHGFISLPLKRAA